MKKEDGKKKKKSVTKSSIGIVIAAMQWVVAGLLGAQIVIWYNNYDNLLSKTDLLSQSITELRAYTYKTKSFCHSEYSSLKQRGMKKEFCDKISTINTERDKALIQIVGTSKLIYIANMMELSTYREIAKIAHRAIKIMKQKSDVCKLSPKELTITQKEANKIKSDLERNRYSFIVWLFLKKQKVPEPTEE